MKYLFIDTNNFINCALEIEIEKALEIINKLEHLLDSGKTELLVPEIVELEIFRVIDYRLSKIKEYKNNLKTVVQQFPLFAGKDKEYFIKDMNKVFNNMDEVLIKRKQSSDRVKQLIKTIFSGKHIIRISLTPEIFLRAIKRAFADKKPYKYIRCPECNELKNIINNDCLIFESIISKMKELGKNNQLIFCSTNTEDFTEKYNKELSRPLHHDLLSDFPKNTSVKYYYHFAEAMKKEFSEKIKATDIKIIVDTARLMKDSSSHLEYTFEGVASAAAAFQNTRRSILEGMASAAAALQDPDRFRSTLKGVVSAAAALQDSGIMKKMESLENSFKRLAETLESPSQKIKK